VALTDAGIEEWACRVVAEAPPLTPARREQLRALLSACASARTLPVAPAQRDQGGAADAA
jgi:hypothetical protein